MQRMLTRSIAQLRIQSPSSSSSVALAPSTHLLQLPPELLHHIFSFLPLADCGQLCLTSRAIRSHVLSWILSTESISQLTESTTLERDSEEVIRSAGIGHLVKIQKKNAGKEKSAEVTRSLLKKLGKDLYNKIVDVYKVDFDIFGYEKKRFEDL